MDFSFAAEKLCRDGYAVIEDFLSKEEISDLRQRMQEIVNNVDPEKHQTVFTTHEHKEINLTRDEYFMSSADRVAFFFEEKALDSNGKLVVDKNVSVNKIGHALHTDEPVFSRVTYSEKVKKLFKDLQFVDPIIFQSMYIFKQPRIGGVVMPHQDSTYLCTNPQRLVGLWIPLEDAGKENSCLWFIPGSHKDGVHNNRYLARKKEGDPEMIFTGDERKYDDSEFVVAEAKAGSLVLIDGDVVHKSEPNTSSRSRHAYTFHAYDGANCEYSKLNWLQPTDKGTFVHLFAQSS